MEYHSINGIPLYKWNIPLETMYTVPLMTTQYIVEQTVISSTMIVVDNTYLGESKIFQIRQNRTK